MSKGKSNKPIKLIPGVHFYIENGLYVFTAQYLKERGYCCKNQCRHCPYSNQPKEPAENQNQDSQN